MNRLVPVLLGLLLANPSHVAAAPAPAPAYGAEKFGLKYDMPDWSKVPVVDHDLGHGVHMLQSFGGNIGVLAGSDGVLLVDGEYPELNTKIRVAVAGISSLPVRYVVNTHWHWDHAGGDADWTRSGAVLISSEETWKHISDAQKAPQFNRPGQYPADPASLPVITVSQEIALHLSGQRVEVFHIGPTHTDGDLVVRFVDADVIQTGDTFFGHFYPSFDVAHGGSIDGLIAWYDRLYAMCGPNTKIIPGHGPVQTREDVRVFQAMLREVRDRVAKAVKAGMSLDQIEAAHLLDDLDKTWGGDLIKQPVLINSVYKDLTKNSH